MKYLLSVICAFILLSSDVALSDDLRPFERMDVFGLEWVSDPQVSPNGKRVVYVRNGMDVMTDGKWSRLWLVDADGSNNLPLTGRDVNESNPVWSPDGKRIAFTSSTDAGTEIFVVWVDNGKSTRLTQLNHSPGGLSWSHDGNHIAFSMTVPEDPVVLVSAPAKPDGATWPDAPRVTARLKYESDGSGYIEPGYRQFFIVPALGGTPRQVTSGNFRHEGTPHWSRDDRALIFHGNRNDDWELGFNNSEIYSVAIDSGEATALTDRNGPDADPVVSPDGSKIAYLGHEDKVQTYQVTRLHVMNIDGSGKRELLTDLDRSVSGLVWNKNSDGIYYQYDDRGDTKIGFTTLGGRASLIASNVGGTTIGRPYGGGSFSVSENDTIAFTHVTPYRPAELAIVAGRRGEAKVVTAFNAALLERRSLGEVEELWYKSSVDDRDIQGWIVKPPGYDPSKAYPLLVENHGGPISNYGPRFSPEIQLFAAAGYVVFYPNPRGSTSYGEEFGNLLYHNYPGDTKIGFTTLGGRASLIASNVGGTTIGRPYGGGSFSVSENDTIAFTHVTPYRPAELAIVAGRRGEAKVVTAFNAALLERRTLGEVEELWYKSSVDDRDIQGWIVKPPGYDASKAYPLLVENHGGPISNYGPRFSPEIQLFATAGYVVFYPNPRGSTSYGEEFGNLLYHNYPGDDYQDVMDGVDTLIESGVTAEDRLYVTGGSAGGIMTAWIIGKNNRFRAAAVVKPVMNWISKTLTADNYYQYANYRFPGQPWENIEAYMQFSPVSLVGNIETPTMVMVGMSDLRTPISESKQLYSALKIRGIDTVLVQIPDAPHNIAGRPSQLITKIDHILAWFAKYPVGETD